VASWVSQLDLMGLIRLGALSAVVLFLALFVLRPLAARIGKVKTSVSCLYISRLEDVDMEVLRELCAWAVATMRGRHPPGPSPD